ncbi:unnamed protein product [Closterium sp. NIES-64]|nr:unnamed protein product [Closterium sp. NIES-64]
MKDELGPLLGKQGSQYWARLARHLEKENPGWVRGVNALQKQWRNLVNVYKQIKKGEKASGKGAVCKPHWYPYMALFQNNKAVGNPHAVDGGGTAHVNVPCGFAVPSTLAPCTSTPTFTAPPPQGTPTSKRPRVAETATMAAAKLVCETIKGCHSDAMSRLEGLVRAWMEQDARIARERVQQPAPSPHVRDDIPAHADNMTDSHAAEGGWLRHGQACKDPSNPDAGEEVWVRGAAESSSSKWYLRRHSPALLFRSAVRLEARELDDEDTSSLKTFASSKPPTDLVMASMNML